MVGSSAGSFGTRLAERMMSDALRNELNFQRFDAKLEQRFAQADVKREQRFAQADAQLAALRDEIGTDLSDRHMSLLRWMFGFWIATLEPLAGLILALR